MHGRLTINIKICNTEFISRMSVGLFLGAGASVPYNYKTTLEMKEHILEYASRISESQRTCFTRKIS